MFGISWAEFLVVLLVAVLVIPARMWPDVAKFLARVVKFVRGVIWKITDVSEKIKEQIERESPIDDLIKTTTDDILAEISEPIKKIKKRTVKKSGGKKK
ncbi:MAG: hypothetical protein J6L70_03780 [Alphaproteobacteria bacterium]|nr:hypothetical protein [Alphaproteobacteria bacterium]